MHMLYITNKNSNQVLKWVCHTDGKAFKTKLAHSAADIIPT